MGLVCAVNKQICYAVTTIKLRSHQTIYNMNCGATTIIAWA